MALSEFNFYRGDGEDRHVSSWENTTDFPTFEPDEAAVRFDLQDFHDQTRDYINGTLVAAVDAHSEEINERVKTIGGVAPDASGNVAAVLKFNNRTGNVAPQSGDYTAAMVGADAAGTASSAVSSHNSNNSAHSGLFSAVNEQLSQRVKTVNHLAPDSTGNVDIGSFVVGVASFNGRTGAVTSQSGDYTADMVGAFDKNKITYSSTPISAGSPLTTGTFYFVYE